MQQRGLCWIDALLVLSLSYVAEEHSQSMNELSRIWSPVTNKESKLRSCHCSRAENVNDVEKDLVRERGRKEPSSNFQTLQDAPTA